MDGQELNITADYGSHESKMQTYLMEGEKQALSLGNRGPIRFTSDGALEKDIVDSYREHGFYIFENVLDKAELTDIESDLKQIQTRLPKDANSNIDASGKPALTANCKSQPLLHRGFVGYTDRYRRS